MSEGPVAYRTAVADILNCTCVFEEALEALRCRLVGNDYFEPRAAFGLLDAGRGVVTADSLAEFVLDYKEAKLSLPHLEVFVRTHAQSERPQFAYSTFLRLVMPRSDLKLAQLALSRPQQGKGLPGATKTLLLQTLGYLVIEANELHKCKRRFYSQHVPNTLQFSREIQPLLATAESFQKFMQQEGKSGEWRGLHKVLRGYFGCFGPQLQLADLCIKKGFFPIQYQPEPACSEAEVTVLQNSDLFLNFNLNENDYHSEASSRLQPAQQPRSSRALRLSDFIAEKREDFGEDSQFQSRQLRGQQQPSSSSGNSHPLFQEYRSKH